MSTDLSALPTKSTFMTNNPPPTVPPPPTPEEVYAIQKEQVNARIARFFGQTGSAQCRFVVSVWFMTTEDKAGLLALLASKGYTATIDSHHLLTIC